MRVKNSRLPFNGRCKTTVKFLPVDSCRHTELPFSINFTKIGSQIFFFYFFRCSQLMEQLCQTWHSIFTTQKDSRNQLGTGEGSFILFISDIFFQSCQHHFSSEVKLPLRPLLFLVLSRLHFCNSINQNRYCF
jgi:hypothetical protein